MKSIIIETSNSEIIARIENLSPQTQALWGKMNVAQMLAHCTVGLKIAFGEIIPKSNFLFKIMGKIFKKKIFAQESFKKNSPTSKEFIIAGEKDFNTEKAILVSYVKQCAEKGADVFSKEPHVFFGKLTVEEWDELMLRHLDHHLKQFGV
jgi:hypothetical protein